MATGLNRDLILVILQFLNEEKYTDAARALERESGLFFNFKYFEELVTGGKWDEVEKYLSGFTKIDDNRFSMKIFFEIRKQKYLEALDRSDAATAVKILNTDLKFIEKLNEDLYKELTQLITLKNFRENEQLSGYVDSETARGVMLVEIKKLLEANPLFTKEKLVFPEMESKRLPMLLNHSINWQHSLCANPAANPDMTKTILVDHNCGGGSTDKNTPPNFSNQNLANTPQKPEVSAPMSMNRGFQQFSTPNQTPLNPWMAANSSRPSSMPVYGGLMNSVPRGPGEFSNGMPSVARATPGANHGPSHGFANDLPIMLARTLSLASAAISMDFHPVQLTVLLVGIDSGEINLWEVNSRERFYTRGFQVRNIAMCSTPLKAALIKEPPVTVRRVVWSFDGLVFGIAYSKSLVHLYLYYGRLDIRFHMEIEAHIGSVNDLAFSKPSKQLYLVTCGDDKLVKVWDVATGVTLHRHEGHGAAVHSVRPHSRNNFHFIFSTSVDGSLKAWLYDTSGSRVDYTAPNQACSTMAYSADGKRLFSCGTTREGKTSMVEWNENEGTIKKAYQGFQKRSLGFVQFDTAKSRYLAAGHDYSVKFWDMDNTNLLTSTNAEGGLVATPRIRYNKDGSLLAVSANENRIKILANGSGLLLMRTRESYLVSASDGPSTKNVGSMDVDVVVKDKGINESSAKTSFKVTEINTPAQFRSLRVSLPVTSQKISRVIYNNSGTGIVVLTTNGVIHIWKWPHNEHNRSRKVTTSDVPKLVKQPSGLLMTNEIMPDSNPDDVVHCFALSRNDSYGVSASGGKVTLYNMLSFKAMTSFMPPPSSATALAFHPQDNNVIAVGTKDSTVIIYNVRLEQEACKLNGHTKRITGLAFSPLQKMLVSSGADSQVIMWDYEKKERRNSFYLFPTGRNNATSDTQIQFHHDQIHLLVINEAQLSIADTRKAECIEQWLVSDNVAPISHAAFSCDSNLVFCGFLDGTLRVFMSHKLQVICQINPSAFFQPGLSGYNVYAIVVAGHPQEANQFAVGLTDGSVVVVEPLEGGAKWGVLESGASGSVVRGPHRGSEQM